jgi:chromosome segregation ATPase
MAGRQEKSLAELESRIKQLIDLCDFLKRQNVVLRKEIEQKDEDGAVLKAEAEQIKAKYENLRFAKAFASGNRTDTQNAKQRLSKLVHDVDKCIALLKI